MTWSTYNGTDEGWDTLVTHLGSSSVFASASWGNYKSREGWNISRLVYSDSGSTSAALLVFWRRYFGLLTIAWIPGGVAGELDFETDGLLSFVSRISSSKFTYCKVAFHHQSSESKSQILRTNGWHRSRSSIGAEETFVLEQVDSHLATESRLSSNWARNLERGLKRNPDVSMWDIPDPAEIHSLYKQMVEFKKARGPRETISLDSLSNLFESMGKNLIVIQSRDTSGQLLAVRGAFVYGDNAWDALAAANADARKAYSSYVCAWRLIEELEKRGVKKFDLAGIDPIANEGVFNFKKGLGGSPITYLGEWDTAQLLFVRRLVGTFISRLS